MAAKVPIRTVFDGEGNATGLAEFQSGEFIDYAYGGTGVATLGSAGQVLKVNSGGTALEYGNVEAIVNIDGATDLTGATLATTDQLLASDGGTEGRVTLAQLDTLFSGTTKTLTNKTLTSPTINTPTITGNTTFSDGAYDFDIASHDGTNGLSLGGVVVTASAAELNYSDGVTSNIQTQLDSKAAKSFAIAQAIALG